MIEPGNYIHKSNFKMRLALIFNNMGTYCFFNQDIIVPGLANVIQGITPEIPQGISLVKFDRTQITKGKQPMKRKSKLLMKEENDSAQVLLLLNMHGMVCTSAKTDKNIFFAH